MTRSQWKMFVQCYMNQTGWCCKKSIQKVKFSLNCSWTFVLRGKQTFTYKGQIWQNTVTDKNWPICFLELFWAQCYVKLCGVCCCCCCSGRKQWRCLILEAGWPGSVFWAVCGSGTGLRRDVGETQLTKLFSLRILFLFFYTLGRNARLGMWLPLTEPPLCLQRRFVLFLSWGKFLTHTHREKTSHRHTDLLLVNPPLRLHLQSPAVWTLTHSSQTAPPDVWTLTHSSSHRGLSTVCHALWLEEHNH